MSQSTAAYEDIEYVVEGPTAIITMNRPQRYNAFRAKTVEEMINAFRRAWADRNVQAVILTGAGEKAFCTGGDVKQRAETGDYGPSESGMFEIGNLHKVIRDIPKPVIAAVNGLAIGGGHVLHVLCDLTIAADTARFGQSGPKVGSFDAGWPPGGAIWTASAFWIPMAKRPAHAGAPSWICWTGPALAALPRSIRW